MSPDENTANSVGRVCYYIQTHDRPAQVTRLVEVIKEGRPDAFVLISHDIKGPALDSARLGALPGVHVLLEQGGYGDFSHISRYLSAIDWLEENGIEYDWLANLSGQDYPLRPMAEIESNIEKIAAEGYDGFLLYAPVFQDSAPPDIDWGAGPKFGLTSPFDAHMRYSCRNFSFGKPTSRKQFWLRPFAVINFVQPWLRLSLAYCTVGVHRRRPSLPSDYVLYGGWFFATLSRRTLEYLRDYARNNQEVMKYYRRTLASEEVFLQTTLVNSGKFRFVPESRHYIDFSGSRYSRSRTLDLNDIDKLRASDAFWGRKFDIRQGTEIFDILDEWVRPVGENLATDGRASDDAAV